MICFILLCGGSFNHANVFHSNFYWFSFISLCPLLWLCLVLCSPGKLCGQGMHLPKNYKVNQGLRKKFLAPKGCPVTASPKLVMWYLPFGTHPDLCGAGVKAKQFWSSRRFYHCRLMSYLSKEQSRKVRNALPQPLQELSAGVQIPDPTPSPLPGGPPTGLEPQQSCGSTEDMSHFV